MGKEQRIFPFFPDRKRQCFFVAGCKLGLNKILIETLHCEKGGRFMSYKRCENCNQVSYSAHDRGIWYCPYCGKDLTYAGLITDVYREQNERVIDKKRTKLYIVK